MSKVTVEFLTLNLYSFVKNESRRRVIYLIKQFMVEKNLKFDSKSALRPIRANLKMIETVIKKEMLNDHYLSQTITYSLDYLHSEHLQLKSAVLLECESKLQLIFIDNPKKAKLKLNIITPAGFSCKKNASSANDLCISKTSLYERNSACSINNLAQASDSEKTGYLRFLGQNFLCKFLFPVFVYKKDMFSLNGRSKSDMILKDKTMTHKFAKSLIGIVSACFLSYLIYNYFRSDTF